MRYARIAGVAYHLPERKLTTEELAIEFPNWNITKILAKTGINSRRIAAEGETALDLAEVACRKLFSTISCPPQEIDALIFCTQSPDYTLPSNSPMLQNRLGLNTNILAFDLSHGCSGFTYCLSLAKAIIETGQATNILVVTADTYTARINKNDKSVRTLFGDGAAATLITAEEANEPFINPFLYHTDGAGAKNLIIPKSGAKALTIEALNEFGYVLEDGQRELDELYMNGSEIYIFALKTVPKLVKKTLEASNYTVEDIDAAIFHQASAVILDGLRQKCAIPQNKFITHYSESGNTVSATIPIALCDALAAGEVKKGDLLLLVGFGVGYSSAAGLVRL